MLLERGLRLVEAKDVQARPKQRSGRPEGIEVRSVQLQINHVQARDVGRSDDPEPVAYPAPEIADLGPFTTAEDDLDVVLSGVEVVGGATAGDDLL